MKGKRAEIPVGLVKHRNNVTANSKYDIVAEAMAWANAPVEAEALACA